MRDKVTRKNGERDKGVTEGKREIRGGVTEHRMVCVLPVWKA